VRGEFGHHAGGWDDIIFVDENRWDEKAGLRTGCGVRSHIDVLEAQIKRRPAMKKVSTVAAKQIFLNGR
jgi:hypothetical protein